MLRLSAKSFTPRVSLGLTGVRNTINSTRSLQTIQINRISTTVPKLAVAKPVQDPRSKVIQTYEADPYQRELFFYSSAVLAAAIPVAAFVPDSIVTHTADWVLGFGIPLHGFMGTRLVIHDYLHGAGRVAAMGILTLLLILCLLGLALLNTRGKGVSATLKSLWITPEKKESKHH